MTQRKGILLSVIAILFAFSIITFFLNFQLFLTDTAEVQADTELGTYTNIISRHTEEIIDLKISQEKNQTHTTINITDRLPRADAFDNELEAYADFLEHQLNISYSTQVNFTAFRNNPQIRIGGINAVYTWPDFTKTNASLHQKKSDTTFVKQYNTTLTALQGFTANNCTLSNGKECDTHTPGSDADLTVDITVESSGCGNACTVFPVTVDKTGTTTFSFNYSDGTGKQVNVTVGTVNGFDASLRIVPDTNISAMTRLTVEDNEIP